jgi:hypothetical protein
VSESCGDQHQRRLPIRETPDDSCSPPDLLHDSFQAVVLTEGDKPKKNTPKKLRPFLAATRYESFFGRDRVSLETDGVKGYFDPILGRTRLKTRLRRLTALMG